MCQQIRDHAITEPVEDGTKSRAEENDHFQVVTKTFENVADTRPRRDVNASRDRDVETKTTSLVFSVGEQSLHRPTWASMQPVVLPLYVITVLS
jgi:hypothetical protein